MMVHSAPFLIDDSPILASRHIALAYVLSYVWENANYAERVITLPDQFQSSYASLSLLLSGLGCVTEEAITISMWDTNGLTAAEHFEDSFRRMSTTNWWDCDRFERAVDLLSAALQKVATTTLGIRLGGIDLPTLRALLTACIRIKHAALTHVFLEVANQQPGSPDDPHSQHRTALVEIIEVAGATLMPSRECAAPFGGTLHKPMSSAPSLLYERQDRELEYLFRNHHLAILGEQSPFARCQLEVLLAARAGKAGLLFQQLALMARLASSSEESARTWSMTAVSLARFASQDLWSEAVGAIKKGFCVLANSTNGAAHIEKGWLHNNLAFIHVLRYSRKIDPAGLSQASNELKQAFAECLRAPGGLNGALHFNVTANALRLLELEHKYPEALTLMERVSGSNEHMALLYRKAMLLSRLHRTTACLDALRLADDRCSERLWPFKLAIANATAYGHVLTNNYTKAADVLEAGLALAVCKRSRRAVLSCLPNLFHCLCRVLGNSAAGRKFTKTVECAGLDAPLLTSLLQQQGLVLPASKLLPYIPELDLGRPVSGRLPINSMLDEKIALNEGRGTR